MESNAPTEREDSQANRAKIRKALLSFIKQELRRPTAEELMALTGLAEKTVRRHLKRIKLGDGSKNPYQVLTSDVMLKLFERATGYQHEAVKILTVSQGAGLGSEVQEVPYTEHYPPDTAAAKLWMQLVEGWGERQELNHSGELRINQPPTIIQITRYEPTSENAPQPLVVPPILLPANEDGKN